MEGEGERKRGREGEYPPSHFLAALIFLISLSLSLSLFCCATLMS